MQPTLQTNSVKERLIFLAPTVQTGVEKECNSNDFVYMTSLGSGAFGQVFKVMHRQTKQVYALKKISKSLIKAQKMVSQVKNEIKIMYGLDHPHIIKLLSHFEDNDFICLILEFAEGVSQFCLFYRFFLENQQGQLWDKLSNQGRFDEKTVQQIIRELISAIEYCHSRKPPIIHRDIKPENILLDKDGKTKLADFGWSAIFNPGSRRKTYCGTLDYLAPEMILEIGHDQSLDVWSLGVLTYELLTGKAPFSPPTNIKDQSKMQAILEDNILNIKIEYPKDIPPLAKDFITRILKKDPKLRLQLKKMKDHSWIKGIIQTQNIISAKKTLLETKWAKPAKVIVPQVSTKIHTLGAHNIKNENKQNLNKTKNELPLTPNKTNDNKIPDDILISPITNSSPGLQVPDTNNSEKNSDIQKAEEEKEKEDEDEDKEDDAVNGGGNLFFKKNKEKLKILDGLSEKILIRYSKGGQYLINTKVEETEVKDVKTSNEEQDFSNYVRLSVMHNKTDQYQQTINELNQKIQDLTAKLNESEANLKIKSNELEILKNEMERKKSESSNYSIDSHGNSSTTEVKKIKLLEEEKNKLMKEFDDVWNALEEKENIIQRFENELKKSEEMKKQVEKYKQEKNALNEANKLLSAQITQLNCFLSDLKSEKEEDIRKFEKQLSEIEMKNREKEKSVTNQEMLKDFFENAKNSMDAIQKKIESYKEGKDNIQLLQSKLNEKEIEIIKIRTDHIIELEQAKTKIIEEYELRLENLEKTFQNDMKILNEKYLADFKVIDQKLSQFKNIKNNSEFNEQSIQTLKQQKDVADTMISDLKTQLNDLIEISKVDKEIIRDLKYQLEENRMSQDSLKKLSKKQIRNNLINMQYETYIYIEIRF